MKKNEITILGAGLVGSLMAIYLRSQGLNVSVYDKRPDKRKNSSGGVGRSINMALSHRGWKSLEEVGLKDKVLPLAIPMHGRRIHDEHGGTSFIPYGKANQAIYSISRGKFNQLLAEEGERLGVNFNFEHKCVDVDLSNQRITFETDQGESKLDAPVIIGADGSYSALRMSMEKQVEFSYKQEYISHGYKELTIPATPAGEFAMDPNALHIWPRGKFMLIALPNPDKSFTCSLFLPFEDEKICFDKINDEEDLESVFSNYFHDAYKLMPDLKTEFFKNPTSALVNVECYPWAQGQSVLLGDASHAMVPFYGQGMNCGFEDCSVLNGLIDKLGTDSWDLVFEKFQQQRKPNTDAICQLAMDNFVEMRDSVSDPKFILRKKIEAKLHELYPNDWIPLYSMVTFSEIPYAQAYAQGKVQDIIMNRVMADPLITANWDKLDYEDIITMMETSKAV